MRFMPALLIIGLVFAGCDEGDMFPSIPDQAGNQDLNALRFITSQEDNQFGIVAPNEEETVVLRLEVLAMLSDRIVLVAEANVVSFGTNTLYLAGIVRLRRDDLDGLTVHVADNDG